MMLDRNTDGIVAALTSLRVCRENVLPMAVWAALIAIVIGAGFLLWFAGLVVAVPVHRRRHGRHEGAGRVAAPRRRLVTARVEQRRP